MKKLLGVLLMVSLLSTSYLPVFADDLDSQLSQIENQIKDLLHQKELSENATKPLESELTGVNSQIADLKAKINNVSGQIDKKQEQLSLLEKNIHNREEEMAYDESLFAEQVKTLYMRDAQRVPFASFIDSNNAQDAAYASTLDASLSRKSLDKIASLSARIKGLFDDKSQAQKERESLAQAKTRFAVAKGQIDDRANFLQGEISNAKKFQETLSTQIAELSAKQQSILSAKSGTFVTGVGDVPLPDDPNSSPTFDPGFRPAFAAFSFGAFTHRKGMSQYGAKGRAISGQNANQIVQAYYGKTPVTKDTGGTISVEGAGSINFEDKYLLGIAEMPSSFPMEALKAQAIAARTYAYRYKQDGQAICTTEACQVYSSDKANNPPDAWKQAVQVTKGQIIEDVVTYYSSTSGGYVSPLGWDTTSNSKDTWTAGAYEKIANSPWFYKGWYTESYSVSSNKCGRSSPWLNEQEMSDILNAYLVQNKGGVDNSKITPITTSCWGGNPYSMDELRNLANSAGGGAVTTISSVSVSYTNAGQTATVTFDTNRGSVSIAGADFKQVFNLRAPGYTSIKSVLFNIEKK